jgi:tetratricopeptide (TPR) repeat protein
MATVDVPRGAPRALKWVYRALFLLGIGVFLGLLAAGGARAVTDRRPPPLAYDVFERGNELERRGDLAGAAREFRALAAVVPTDLHAFDSLARVLRAGGDQDGALAAHRAALLHHPLSASARRDLGLALLARRGWGEAQVHLTAAVRLDPGDVVALAALGDVRRERGDFAGAIDAYLHALALRPGDAALHNKLGIAYALAGQPAAARARFEEAIRLDPTSGTAPANLRRLTPATP